MLCVHGHSGYLLVVPIKEKGLTAEAVARQMISYWVTVFGMPKAIHSDNGSHFNGAWFRTMCQLMGARHARTVAYHSRSHGRAEVSGRFEHLKKLHLERPVRNWLTIMWRLIQGYHDLLTFSGYSPHRTVFGRDPLLGGRNRYTFVPLFS